MEHGPGDGEGMAEGMGETLDAETTSRDGLLVAEPSTITMEAQGPPVTAIPTEFQRPSMTATKRFQSSVRRAILIRRNGQYDEKIEGEKGSRSREPGIDPRKVDLPDLQSKVVIQTVDYSREVSPSSSVTYSR